MNTLIHYFVFYTSDLRLFFVAIYPVSRWSVYKFPASYVERLPATDTGARCGVVARCRTAAITRSGSSLPTGFGTILDSVAHHAACR